MHEIVSAQREALAKLCQQFGVKRLEVFGSGARAFDFDPARSDADFLVEFEDSRYRFAHLLRFNEAIEVLMQRPVDLISRNAVETERNHIRRRRILSEAEEVYAR